jgi:hypothetical protein
VKKPYPGAPADDGALRVAMMHPTRLPHEWHKTMPDPFLVCGITGQIPGKEAFFVNEPPNQKWHHRGD